MNNAELSTLQRSRLQLELEHEQAHSQYKALHTQVSQHQARLSWQPEVKNILEKLQTKEHERQVGAYEKLLTALLEDVLPGYREVVLKLYTHRSAPALDLAIRKGRGEPLENILSGTGGSVANIISAGLRIIALIRSGKRRFLVLDEADCWIKPIWAPKFAAVIQQMALQMGVQVLMISHHEESLFPMIAHKLRLEKGPTGLSTHWSPDSELPVWNDDQVGLRSILLEDFQAHHMTFLPLSPGLTLLSGDNDIGKSAVVSALRSVFHNEASDEDIRHHQKSARVTMDFGPDHVLRWERFAKGKTKEIFQLYDASKGPQDSLFSTNGAKYTPDWLEPALGIGFIEEMDVQLRSQKSVIFLLDQPNTQRAKALAIGEEAGHVQTMIAIDRQENTDARRAIQDGESQLEGLSRKVQVLTPIIASKDRWARIESLDGELSVRVQERAHQHQLQSAWGRSSAENEALRLVSSHPLPPLPALRTSAREGRLAQAWQLALAQQAALQTLQVVSPTAPPTPPKAAALKSLLEQWSKQSEVQQAIQPLMERSLAAPPTRSSAAHMNRVLAQWRRALAYVDLLGPATASPLAPAPLQTSQALMQLEERWRANAAEKQALAMELQSIETRLASMETVACPTCGKPLASD